MALRGLLHIGGVIAAGAGIVGVPADGRAGGGLCVVTHTVMALRGLLHIGGVIAAGAGLVSVPADGGAGGSLCFMLHLVVGGIAVVALASTAVGRRLAGGGFGFGVG